MVGRAFIYAMLLMLLPLSVNSKYLDPIGTIFQIDEPDLLVVIAQHLKQMDEAGLIKSQQQQFKAQVQQQVLRPRPALLPTTKVVRQHHYDPSMIVEQDIVDDKGNLVVAAGTTVNPLDLVGLPSPLLFFNGDDEAQLCWVNKQIKAAAKVTLILVQGDVGKMGDHFEQTLYFDQFGKLIKQLGITQVPAVVTQEDLQLLIDEQHPCFG